MERRIFLFKEDRQIGHNSYVIRFFVNEKCCVDIDIINHDLKTPIVATKLPLVDLSNKNTSVPRSILFEMLVRGMQPSERMVKYRRICQARIPWSIKGLKLA